MTKSDILQDISVELSKSIKKHLQHIKQLPSADKKQIEKLISNLKDGLDDLSEANINEAKGDFVASTTSGGGRTVITVKKAADDDLAEKIYYDMSDYLKKQKIGPKEILIKF